MRVRSGDVVRLLVSWAGATVAVLIAAEIVPDISAENPWSYVLVAAVAGVVGLLVRPVLVEISARIGWLGVIVVALAGQAAVMYFALTVVPGISATFLAAFLASWVVAAVSTTISYVSSAGTDEALVSALRRRRGLRGDDVRSGVEHKDVDGVVFVQIDGVPFPVLRWAVRSGAVPTIRRWLASGEYQLREWIPQLPCTTPASQLGLLHGTVDRIPAFRWYDRELGRVMVANRPADARVIEERASTGRGLLCEDGVSISNLFTGDAARSMLTMSRSDRSSLSRGSRQTRQAFAWFLYTPAGFTRSMTRTVAEVVKERWQARRQVRRGLEPRTERGWTFAILRALTNGVLRDLNTALVAEEMMRGTRSVYVDYVDYDEIAHHAGMFRPESLASLDGLDRVLASLAKLAEAAPRRYRIVVVSDHGQSQGDSFADRYGEDLAAVCERLMAQKVAALEEPVESWGRAASLTGDVAGRGLPGRIADDITDRVTSAPDDRTEEVVVLGSGNLGLVYVPGRRRLTLEEIDERWPELVPGLARHRGVGFVAALDGDGTPWAFGAGGRQNLASGEVEGDDPLAPFGQYAPGLLRRAVEMPEAPDVYVNSLVDDMGDVAAFEHLVGSHGGLGGWQDRAVLLVPTDLAGRLPDGPILGADHLHECLVGILEQCGQRGADGG
jgi:uncharacterized membrane protein YvlD (DUF360 family)